MSSLLLIVLGYVVPLVVDAEDGGAQRQELGAHHQDTSRNVMVLAYQQRGKGQGHGAKKTANRHKRLDFFIMYHNLEIKREP